MIVVLSLVCALSWPGGAASTDRKLTFTRNGIIVPAWINDVGPYPFLLDTSIPHPVIAADAATYLKLAVSGDTVQAKAFGCGGQTCKDVTFSVMDLNPLRQRFGAPVAGVFSGRELGGAFVLDIQRGVFEPVAGGSTVTSDSPRNVPLAVSELEGVSVQALVNGTSLRRFVVDTTFAGAVSAPQAMLQEAGWKSDGARRLAGMAPSTGGPQVRLKSLRVGGAELIDPVCTVAEGVPRIGLDFLRYFRATFDCRSGLLTLQPLTPRTPRQGPIVGCGLTPSLQTDGFWALSVAEGSSAARQGVQSGDLLLKVGDKEMRGTTFQDAFSALDVEPDGTLAVTVRSGAGESRSVTVTAERLL